jgi:phosphoribosylformylglycinamidine synthase
MAAHSIDTAIRQAIVSGGTLNHLAILDNFCWSSSGNPERLFELREAAKACYDFATLYGTPFISGKDSMWNDFRGYDEKGNFRLSLCKMVIAQSVLIT